MPKAKCPVCHQRKGKRVCPAQGGALICPKCCAQNRVRVYDCPADCAYLGGEGSLRLAAKRSEDFSPPPLQTVDALLNTLVESAPKANLIGEAEPTALAALEQLAQLSEGADTDGAVESALWEWIVLGAQTPEGRPLVDRVLEKFPRPLSEEELTALEALHRSHYRLLRIEEFQDDRTRVTDRLGDDELTVSAPGLRDQFEVGRTVGCFVTPTDQGLSVMLGAWGLPEGGEEAMLERLEELRDESPLKELLLSEFITRVSIVVPLLIYEQLSEEVSPEDSPPPFL